MRTNHRKATAAIVTAAALSAAVITLECRKEEKKRTCSRIKRERRSVEQIYRSLGLTHFCRAFRMDYDKFQLLHHKLEAEIKNVMSHFYIQKD